MKKSTPFLYRMLPILLGMGMTSATISSTSKMSNARVMGGGMGFNDQAIYSPKKTKFKGYMRHTSTFNKNK